MNPNIQKVDNKDARYPLQSWQLVLVAINFDPFKNGTTKADVMGIADSFDLVPIMVTYICIKLLSALDVVVSYFT